LGIFFLNRPVSPDITGQASSDISGCQSFHADTDADRILFSSDEVLIPLLIQENAQWEISKMLPSTDEMLIFKFGHSD
jgi:hypothetical protein